MWMRVSLSWAGFLCFDIIFYSIGKYKNTFLYKPHCFALRSKAWGQENRIRVIAEGDFLVRHFERYGMEV